MAERIAGAMSLDDLQSRLVEELGRHWVRRSPRDLIAYSWQATGEKCLPDVVVFPESTAQVATCVRMAAEYGLPLVPRGAGTNPSGGGKTDTGGMVINLVRMNRIKRVNPDARVAVVEAGVTNEALQRALFPHGLFYAPDPSSMIAATIGGSLAENAAGPRCAKYGVTINHTLGVTMVLSGGVIVELGGECADPPGIDLLGVVVGSEGTLGIITEAVLKLTPLPLGYRTLLAAFDDLQSAVATASAIIADRILPATLELLDRNTLKAIIANESSPLPRDAGAVIILEVDGDPAELEAQVERIVSIMLDHDATRVEVAQNAAEREALWSARRAAYGALAEQSPSLSAMDLTVPRDRLVEMLQEIMRLSRENRLNVCLAAHAGDGDMHPTIPYDPGDPEEVARLTSFCEAIAHVCSGLGGSMTGEHGNDPEKPGIRSQFSEKTVGQMHVIRKVFDPAAMMNPGKALPMPVGW